MPSGNANDWRTYYSGGNFLPGEMIPIPTHVLNEEIRREYGINYNPISGNYFWVGSSQSLTLIEIEQILAEQDRTNLRREQERELYRSAIQPPQPPDPFQRSIVDYVERMNRAMEPTREPTRAVDGASISSIGIDEARDVRDFSGISDEEIRNSNRGKWPVGTIIKWNIEIPGIREHIRQNNISSDLPLLKILNYDSNGSIGFVKNFGCVESTHLSVEAKYFLRATEEEIVVFEKAFAELKICTTRPDIGTVIKYVGSQADRVGKRMVVIAHARDNRVYLNPLNSTNPGFRRGIYKFDVFSIAKTQAGGFTPLAEEYCNCQSCGSMRHKVSTTLRVENLYFCDNDCAIRYGMISCRRCGTVHTPATSHETSDGQVCTICVPQYCSCIECERITRIDRMRADSAGRWHCQVCIANRGRIILDYSYKPFPIYQKMSYENTRYLGIELEIEIEGASESGRERVAKNVKEWLAALTTSTGKSLDKLVYLKSDGSLREGFEIVFHPFTLKAFHKNFPSQSFLKYIQEQGANAHLSGRCGMHVHVSKEKVSKDSLLKGKWFFYKCAPFLKKFSGRTNFSFCSFEEQPPNEDPYYQPLGRRTAFNVAGSTKTLELRLFNGTLEHEKFLSNLQFSDSFVGYIQQVSMAFIKKATPHQLWENYLDWSKKAKEYQVMTNYILRNAIV